MEHIFTENKCLVNFAWQTKQKHMQRSNMIMLISCQELCVWASYFNYTTSCICSAWALDFFQLTALLKTTSWLLEELAWLTASRAETLTVLLSNYYVEKKQAWQWKWLFHMWLVRNTFICRCEPVVKCNLIMKVFLFLDAVHAFRTQIYLYLYRPDVNLPLVYSVR